MRDPPTTSSPLVGPDVAKRLRGGDDARRHDQAARRHGRAGRRHGGALGESVLVPPDRDLAAKVVKLNNDKMAELCAAHPDRFAGFASLTLQDPLAVQELERAMGKQGLKGAAVGANFAGVPFSDPRFHPVWAKAEELGRSLFFHPQGIPELNDQLGGNGWLANAVAYPTETTITLSSDFRGHARQIPPPQDHPRAWRRLAAALRRPQDHPAWSIPAAATPTSAEEAAERYLKQICSTA